MTEESMRFHIEKAATQLDFLAEQLETATLFSKEDRKAFAQKLDKLGMKLREIAFVESEY